MDEKRGLMIYNDHVLGLSYRTLGRKYGIGVATAYDIVKKQKDQLKGKQQFSHPSEADSER